MRKYVFGTGIIGVATSGLALLRALRDEERFTWRDGLVWASWAITLALSIGAMADVAARRKEATAPARSARSH